MRLEIITIQVYYTAMSSHGGAYQAYLRGTIEQYAKHHNDKVDGLDGTEDEIKPTIAPEGVSVGREKEIQVKIVITHKDKSKPLS